MDCSELIREITPCQRVSPDRSRSSVRPAASAPDQGPVARITPRARRRRVAGGRQSCAQVAGIAVERGGTIFVGLMVSAVMESDGWY